MNDQREPRPASESEHRADPTDWRQQAKRYLTIAVACLVGVLVAAAVIPRWWARRLGDWIDGSLTGGSLTGVVMGFVCTFVAALLLVAAFRRRSKGSQSLWLAIAAVVLLLPVLATFWVAVGSGTGAKAGRRILDVDGPGVRGGTLIGVLAGIGGAVALEYLLWSRRRARAQSADAD